jgi:DNA-binding NarL/FixJ family response regulator
MMNIQIVDDHNILIDGICRIIELSGIAVVSNIYSKLDDCRTGLAASRPDILLLDVHLPYGNGVEFCAEMKNLYPDLKIIMLTGFNELSIAKRSLKSGADGYILKSSGSETIMNGIKSVFNGKTFICEEIEHLMKISTDEAIWITEREKDVLRLIAEGCTDQETADRLFLSKETIKGYRKDLLLKFNTKNSVAMVRMAIEQELI